MKTSIDLINLIESTLNGDFGKSNSAEVALPDGTVCHTDVGYVDDFWEDFKKALPVEYYANDRIDTRNSVDLYKPSTQKFEGIDALRKQLCSSYLERCISCEYAFKCPVQDYLPKDIDNTEIDKETKEN